MCTYHFRHGVHHHLKWKEIKSHFSRRLPTEIIVNLSWRWCIQIWRMVKKIAINLLCGNRQSFELVICWSFLSIRCNSHTTYRTRKKMPTNDHIYIQTWIKQNACMKWNRHSHNVFLIVVTSTVYVFAPNVLNNLPFIIAHFVCHAL